MISHTFFLLIWPLDRALQKGGKTKIKNETLGGWLRLAGERGRATLAGMIRLLLVLVLASPLAAAPSPPAPAPDMAAHLIDCNRAQLVMMAEARLLPPAQIKRLAGALRAAAAAWDTPGAPRSSNALDLEQRMAELAGPEVSDLHLGRSRNDLGETMNRMALRGFLLGHVDRITAVRAELHRLAAAHTGTVMPGYTHAVQAQPTTLAHMLLASDAALARDTQRLRQIYARTNRSPLGSGAFTTSGFRLDRTRLARLLGFEGLVENSYDAIMVAAADSKVEYAAALGLSALQIGRLAQSILFQYSDPEPGLLLAAGLATRSSSMPQKRNPSAIERLRLAASEVMANAHASALFAHNTPLYEVKDVREDHMLRLERFAAEADGMYDRLLQVLASLVVVPERLRGQVDEDYSTMTELAEMLRREAGVPFRTGHQVASELSAWGREQGKRPRDLSHAEVARIYHQVTGQELPLDEAQVRRAFDPAAVVAGRAGTGGPQPAETRRMLAAQQADAAAASSWVRGERKRLDTAAAALRAKAEALVGN